MVEKLRKICCEECIWSDLDKTPAKMQDFCGFVHPVKGKDGKIKWEITTMFEGEGYTTGSQDIAQIISSLEEVKSLLLKLLSKK